MAGACHASWLVDAESIGALLDQPLSVWHWHIHTASRMTATACMLPCLSSTPEAKAECRTVEVRPPA